MRIFKYLGALVCALCMAVPLSHAKKASAPRNIELILPTSANVSQRYGNLDYGLRIQVRSDVREDRFVNTADLPSKEAADVPSLVMDYTLTECIEQYLDSYATGLGFKVGSSSNSDYVLRVTIKDFRLRIRDYNIKKKVFASSGAMVISWELLDAANQTVIGQSTCTGRGTARTMERIAYPLTQAYEDALNGIDWDRIASQLKIAGTARQEKNKEVTGAGNSALEHTVIRWYIISTPQGADVSWRVVSSTPGVANTNANFVGNTPYESTESFDIKGLTYNNSGNVQIEVTCEKAGYLPQRKRFNLRQAIDQKEISAKFNLVKEEVVE